MRESPARRRLREPCLLDPLLPEPSKKCALPAADRWLAHCSSGSCSHRKKSGRPSLQYTIETRELTNGHTHHPSFDGESRRTVIEAKDENEAITRYVSDS